MFCTILTRNYSKIYLFSQKCWTLRCVILKNHTILSKQIFRILFGVRFASQLSVIYVLFILFLFRFYILSRCPSPTDCSSPVFRLSKDIVNLWQILLHLANDIVPQTISMSFESINTEEPTCECNQ